MKKLAVIFSLTVITIMIILSGAYLGVGMYYKTHFLAHTRINGIDVSGMTAGEAEDTIADAMGKYRIALKEKDGREEVLAGEEFDYHYVSSEALLEYLDQQKIIEWLPRYLRDEVVSDTMSDSVSYDDDLLKQAMLSLQCFQEDRVIAPVDAGLIQSEDGIWEIRPETEGNRLDEARVFELLKMTVEGRGSSGSPAAFSGGGTADQAGQASGDGTVAFQNGAAPYIETEVIVQAEQQTEQRPELVAAAANLEFFQPSSQRYAKKNQKKSEGNRTEHTVVIDLNAAGCYELPKINAQDEKLHAQMNTLNQYAHMTVTWYLDGEVIRTLDSATINEWLVLNEQNQATFSYNTVHDYVVQLAVDFDTIRTGGIFETSQGETVYAEAGDGGWQIDQERETNALYQILLDGQSAERTPIVCYKSGSDQDSETVSSSSQPHQDVVIIEDGTLGDHLVDEENNRADDNEIIIEDRTDPEGNDWDMIDPSAIDIFIEDEGSWDFLGSTIGNGSNEAV